jgi:hypothetical protein
LGRTQFGPKLTYAFCRKPNAINEVNDYINTFLRCLTAPNAPLLRLHQMLPQLLAVDAKKQLACHV